MDGGPKRKNEAAFSVKFIRRSVSAALVILANKQTNKQSKEQTIDKMDVQ